MGEATETESRKAHTRKLETEDEKTKEEDRGTLWRFLENECGPEERELVRDFLLPTAAALALSLPQVRIASPFQHNAVVDKMLLDNNFNPR